MIGIMFILRVLLFIVYFVIACALILTVIFVVNRAIQYVGNMMDVEVGDFFHWVAKKYHEKR